MIYSEDLSINSSVAPTQYLLGRRRGSDRSRGRCGSFRRPPPAPAVCVGRPHTHTHKHMHTERLETKTINLSMPNIFQQFDMPQTSSHRGSSATEGPAAAAVCVQHELASGGRRHSGSDVFSHSRRSSAVSPPSGRLLWSRGLDRKRTRGSAPHTRSLVLLLKRRSRVTEVIY